MFQMLLMPEISFFELRDSEKSIIKTDRLIKLLFQFRRFFGHRRLQAEIDSRSNMDANPTLFDLYAHVGRRRRRRQGCHAKAKADALDPVESTGFTDHKLYFRLERRPGGGRARRCNCTWSLSGLAGLESQGCGAECVRGYGSC